jgi:phage FluMu protein Com
MPTLACRVCGRVVYTTAPLDALLADERRCPRCGAVLDTEERRVAARRKGARRCNPADDPGPPQDVERRIADRRQNRRRRDEGSGIGGV